MGRHSDREPSLPERSEHDDDSEGRRLLAQEPLVPSAPTGHLSGGAFRTGGLRTAGLPVEGPPVASTRRGFAENREPSRADNRRGAVQAPPSRKPANAGPAGQKKSSRAGKKARKQTGPAAGARALIGRKWAKPGVALVSVAALAGGLSLIGGGSSSAAANVVANSTFDSGLQGWFVNAGTNLTLVQGREGNAAQISQDGPGSRTIVLNDTVNTVGSTVNGALYTADAWIRSTSPNTSVSLRIMEYDESALRGQGKSSLWLTDTQWHEVRLTYFGATNGATLDLNVVGNQVPAGVGVDIDDITLLDPAASTGPATPAPVPTTAAPIPTVAPTTVAPTPTAKPTTKPPAPAPTTTISKPPVTTPPVAAPPVAPPGWHEVWGDEFNGSSINRANWNVLNNSTYGEGNKELECSEDRPQNVSEGGGVLTITALHESTPVKCSNNDPRFPNGRSYTSGHLNTLGLHSWTYGRFEERAKLPIQSGTSKGMWPAFWMRPVDGGTGEIDTMEAIGSSGSDPFAKTTYQTIHYDYIGTYPQQGNAYNLPNGNLADGYHTYAVEWEPGVIRFYVDDKLTVTRDEKSTPWLDSAFSKPFYLRINMAVGGNWPGAPDAASILPAKYKVDWVRVFQH